MTDEQLQKLLDELSDIGAHLGEVTDALKDIALAIRESGPE